MIPLPTILIHTKYHINPTIQLRSYKVRLQSRLHFGDEVVGATRPRRKNNATHLHTVLCLTENQIIVVDEEGWEVVELGDELFHVAGVGLFHDGLPGV